MAKYEIVKGIKEEGRSKVYSEGDEVRAVGKTFTLIGTILEIDPDYDTVELEVDGFAETVTVDITDITEIV